MKTARASVSLATLLLIGPAGAQVASYDCANATTAAEHTICASATLGRKDVTVASYYDLLLHLKPATAGMAYREFDDQLRNQQQQFLATRNACGGNARCLDARYDERIAALRKTADRYGAIVFDRPGVP